ncbi:hypothetical protein [Allorhodopirellula solitaria]|uniref:EF hand n=1 Tax=Allorhodopirellula solitaria TaxID=2527987 RepID=A0A5C5X270_9BACT|nr:hypothetical protein [Allorhodopirellula solitaria]TWT56263.1 EF hand [Allorhodopirellula solitaria]
MRLFLLPLAFSLAAFVHSTASAQDASEGLDAFHQIVCSAAVDVDSPLHELSLRVVEKQRFHDRKFDAFIRDTLNLEKQDSLVTDRDMAAVQALMPYCTIPPQERVDLLLDQLEASRDALGFLTASRGNEIDLTNKRYTPARIVALASLVQQYQPALLDELKVRLAEERPHWILVSAANLLETDSEELLPLLIQAAKGSDVRLQYAAVDAINQMDLPQAGTDADLLVRNNSDSMKFALATIQRFDKNGDNRLDESEWDDKLAPVRNADVNQDNFVTAEELADYMESRRRR